MKDATEVASSDPHYGPSADLQRVEWQIIHHWRCAVDDLAHAAIIGSLETGAKATAT
jgi:hypothetical protein